MTTGNVITDVTTLDEAAVLALSGVLNARSYVHVRDVLIKAALDHPSAVIADISDLEVPGESALTVFTSTRWHISRWPDVPLLLACEHERGRTALKRNGITRHVPVFVSVREAAAAVESLSTSLAARTSGRRRERAELPAHPISASLARNLISQWLTEWGQHDMIPVAKVVATIFIENALQHSTGQPSLRLESDGDGVTVAVEDNSHLPIAVQEDKPGLSSLKIIDALCTSWGSNPIPTGKAVWGVIPPENGL